MSEMIRFLKKYTLCILGLHVWVEYQDRLREGDFFCKNCWRYMTDDDQANYTRGGKKW